MFEMTPELISDMHRLCLSKTLDDILIIDFKHLRGKTENCFLNIVVTLEILQE